MRSKQKLLSYTSSSSSITCHHSSSLSPPPRNLCDDPGGRGAENVGPENTGPENAGPMMSSLRHQRCTTGKCGIENAGLENASMAYNFAEHNGRPTYQRIRIMIRPTATTLSVSIRTTLPTPYIHPAVGHSLSPDPPSETRFHVSLELQAVLKKTFRQSLKTYLLMQYECARRIRGVYSYALYKSHFTSHHVTDRHFAGSAPTTWKIRTVKLLL